MHWVLDVTLGCNFWYQITQNSFLHHLQRGWLNCLVVWLTDGLVKCAFFLSEDHWSSEVCIKRNLGAKRACPACRHMTALHGSHRDNTCTISPPLGHWQNMPKHLMLSLLHLSIAASQLQSPNSVLSSGYCLEFHMFSECLCGSLFFPKTCSRWIGWDKLTLHAN